MVPFSVILIPLYIRIADIGLSNSLGGIIVTGLWSTFGIFMMRQFMETIPFELLDAARIDGASEWQNLLDCDSACDGADGGVGRVQFLANWDSYLWPLVVLNSPEKQSHPAHSRGSAQPLFDALRYVGGRVDADCRACHVHLRVRLEMGTSGVSR